MKKFLGLALFGLIAAGVGAAATIFALKKKEELEAYEDYDDEKFFDDCDCDCESCAGCEDAFDASDDDNDEDVDIEKDLDTMSEDTSDLEKQDGSDF